MDGRAVGLMGDFVGNKDGVDAPLLIDAAGAADGVRVGGGVVNPEPPESAL